MGAVSFEVPFYPDCYGIFGTGDRWMREVSYCMSTSCFCLRFARLFISLLLDFMEFPNVVKVMLHLLYIHFMFETNVEVQQNCE